jgi:hypothetical protein
MAANSPDFAIEIWIIKAIKLGGGLLMKKILQIAVCGLLSIVGIMAVIPAADARVVVGIGLGGYYGSPYYAPYYGYGYPGYYPPAYYAAPPTVVYQQAAPQVTYAQPPAPYQQGMSASQASQAYTDSQGRTCRQFQSSIDGAPVNGTACLQPDGSWRTVD